MKKTFCDVCGREVVNVANLNRLTTISRGPGTANGFRDSAGIHLQNANPIDGRYGPSNGDYCGECVMRQIRGAINVILGQINPNEAVVEILSRHMVKRLDANNDKGGWKAGGCTRAFLVKRLMSNAERLAKGPPAHGSYWDLAADVANFAMMLVDRQYLDFPMEPRGIEGSADRP